MKPFVIATVAALAASLASPSMGAPDRHLESGSGAQAALVQLRLTVQQNRRVARDQQARAGLTRTPVLHEERHTRSVAYLRFLVKRWWERARDARRYERARAIQLPAIVHRDAWLCIHQYEGAWNDPNSPYYGGLQMDIGFQATYGGTLLKTKGTADNWTPEEQMAVAEKAWKTRGFTPWPNTARTCGLL